MTPRTRAETRRVLVIHGRYRSGLPSGENQVVDTEVALLRAAGLQVERYGRCSDEVADMSLLTKAMLPGRVVWSEMERRRCRAVIRRFDPDVVHVHNTFPLLSPSILASCRDEGRPVVMTLHNFRLACANGLLLRDGVPCELCVGRQPLPALRYGCYRGSRPATMPVAGLIGVHRLLGTHARFVDRFLGLTAFSRHVMIRSGLPAGRITVKPNSAPDPGRRRVGPGGYVLFLGRLEPAKGVDVLLDAWSGTVPGDGRLLIAGAGEMATAVAAFARGRPDVQFLGHCSAARCAELTADARALVVPSRLYENLPLSVLEAFAAGVGVIGPDHGPFPELLGENVRGWRTKPGDPAALREVLNRVLRDDELVVATGRRARTEYERRYTPERNLANLLEAYAAIRSPEAAA